MSTAITDHRLLIVDDNLNNIQVLQQTLEDAGYSQLLSTRDPSTAEHLCEAWQPDLVLLDLHMPRLSGYEVLGRLGDRLREPNNLPVLVITADDTLDARHRALSLGARDFITKPIDQVELLLRVRNLLQTRQLQRELQQRNADLNDAVRERTIELEGSRLESLTILALVGEYHDDDTHHHTRRVGHAAARIAEALGEPESFVADLREAAPLHDIGKVGVSRQILRKSGWLTDEERELIKRHVHVGAQILESAHSPILKLAHEIAGSHHEHWDGAGYPDGLSGTDIPLAARITAVADVFDALTHDRPYKQAWSLERATDEISAQAGHHFDPQVVRAFRSLNPEELAHGLDTIGALAVSL